MLKPGLIFPFSKHKSKCCALVSCSGLYYNNLVKTAHLAVFEWTVAFCCPEILPDQIQCETESEADAEVSQFLKVVTSSVRIAIRKGNPVQYTPLWSSGSPWRTLSKLLFREDRRLLSGMTFFHFSLLSELSHASSSWFLG